MTQGLNDDEITTATLATAHAALGQHVNFFPGPVLFLAALHLGSLLHRHQPLEGGLVSSPTSQSKNLRLTQLVRPPAQGPVTTERG